MFKSVFTEDDNNNAAIRTVSVKGIVESNKQDIFTEDENGNAAIRVVGGGSIDENRVIIKSADIPVAGADVLGQMYCYDGTTNATYTHGYVYECVEGASTYTGTVEFNPATLSGTTAACSGDAFAAFVAEWGSGNITDIIKGTLTYDQSGGLLVFVGQDDTDTTVCTFQLYTQDYEDAGFTFTGTLEDGDVITFACTVTESSTYSWERIDLQPAPELGRYLSTWNCATGLAGTNPPVSPYTYKTGDYFIVGAVATGGANNYKPNGSSYVTGQASTTVETNSVAINDTYFYDGTNWTLLKTGSTVTSVNGHTGDVTVQETLVSGTNIKTINGNSVLGSGDLTISGGGIEWAVSLDYVAGTTYGAGYLKPVWVIADGLPDGNYEFYQQVRLTLDGQLVTYKIFLRLYTDDGNRYFTGHIAPMINGDYISSFESYQPTYHDVSNFIFVDGNDLVMLFSENPLMNNMFYDNNGDSIDGLYKVSKITNVDTGDVYTPTGHFYYPNGGESYSTGINGSIYEQNLLTIPSVPSYYMRADSNWDSNSPNALLFNNGQSGIISVPDYRSDVSTVDIAISSSLGGKFHAIIENGTNSYTAKLLEATGDLADAEIKYDENGGLGVAFNFQIQTSRSLRWQGAFYSSTIGGGLYLNYDYGNYVNNYPNTVSFDTVGTLITPTNYGRIVQYLGEVENVAYTKGYFYQATGTLVTVPASMTCTETSSTGTTITCSDADAFLAYLSSLVNISVSGIKYYFDSGYTSFSYDEDGNWWWNLGYTGTDADFGTYFTFSPSMPSYIEFRIAYTPGYQEVQNPAWVQYNTQPMSTGTTGTLVAANWAGGSQTITVNGVTASNNVVPTPAPASAADWASAGILCTAQSTNSLTFTCTQTPSNDITVNVLIFD